MNLYSYMVKIDRGLAPNPFWGHCTLAVDTPNHKGIKPQKDDWIIGFSTKERGNSLVYAMHVRETMYFDDYFKDARFQEKKPDLNGIWQKRCGDNFYELGADGQWIQHENAFHATDEDRVKDTKHPYVFIAEHFYYFGEKTITIPEEFQKLIFDQRGYKFNFNPKIVEGFIAWLSKRFNPGVHGNPKDKE
jgi:hypothetical protein